MQVFCTNIHGFNASVCEFETRLLLAKFGFAATLLLRNLVSVQHCKTFTQWFRNTFIHKSWIRNKVLLRDQAPPTKVLCVHQQKSCFEFKFFQSKSWSETKFLKKSLASKPNCAKNCLVSNSKCLNESLALKLKLWTKVLLRNQTPPTKLWFRIQNVWMKVLKWNSQGLLRNQTLPTKALFRIQNVWIKVVDWNKNS